MSNNETVTTGRAKRSTAGNRMRELLEKAHQEDDDELFKEVEDDEEFAAPQEVKDVYLDEFADTDEEVEDDEEAEERAIRREERQKTKGKGRAIFDPLSTQNKNKFKSKPLPVDKLLSDPTISLLDPTLDPSSMAPSTLQLALRRKRREAKREQRVESRRSNLRASTLKTEAEIVERENEERERIKNSKKGRKAQHISGEIRGIRPMTQFELIEAALIEEERNKEALKDWLKKEDEKRELRKISRKRVKGPRLTWVSRTVGKLVEVVGEEEVVKEVVLDKKLEEVKEKGEPTRDDLTKKAEIKDGRVENMQNKEDQGKDDQVKENEVDALPKTVNEVTTDKPKPISTVDQTTSTSQITSDTSTEPSIAQTSQAQHSGDLTPSMENQITTSEPVQTDMNGSTTTSKSAENPVDIPSAPEAGPSQPSSQPTTITADKPMQEITQPDPTTDESKYTRNYLILSQVPGGLTEEIKLILGDHVEWDQVSYIPARNRPINRKRPICPFTGLPARYRHPSTNIHYADSEGYKQIQALLNERYKYDEGGWWIGGEEDISADGMEGVEGWWEGVNGGWLGGREIPEPEVIEEVIPEETEMIEEVEIVQGKRKRGKESASSTPVPIAKKGRGRGRPSFVEVDEGSMSPVVEVGKKGKAKGKRK